MVATPYPCLQHQCRHHRIDRLLRHSYSFRWIDLQYHLPYKLASMAKIHLQFTFAIAWVDNWASAISDARYMAGVIAFHLENSMQTAGPPHAHGNRINRAKIVLCFSGTFRDLIASLTAGNPSIPCGINSIFINCSRHPNHPKSHQRRHPPR
jgi:hypothetical protein